MSYNPRKWLEAAEQFFPRSKVIESCPKFKGAHNLTLQGNNLTVGIWVPYKGSAKLVCLGITLEEEDLDPIDIVRGVREEILKCAEEPDGNS